MFKNNLLKENYLLLVIVGGIFVLCMYSTFALFSVDKATSSDVVSLSVTSSITTTLNISEYKSISVSAGEYKIIKINVNNSKDSSLYYGVYYEMVSPSTITSDITIARLSSSSNPTSGSIDAGGLKDVTIIIINDEDEDIEVNIGVGSNDTNELGLSDTQVLITGEVSEVLSFEADSWETIASNTDSSFYKVGDTKCVALDGFTTSNNNGCSNGEFLVRIANKSTPAECSGEDYSETACGFVVEFVDIISEHSMNSTDTNVGGWSGSEMYTYLNDDTAGVTSIYNAMPSDIKNVIINTKSVTGYASEESTNFTSNTDKLYLLSPVEVWGVNEEVTSYDSAYTSSRQLDYYQSAGVTTLNHGEAVKQYQGSNSDWWLRVPCSDSIYVNGFSGVGSNGDLIVTDANSSFGVAPAFRIG